MSPSLGGIAYGEASEKESGAGREEEGSAETQGGKGQEDCAQVHAVSEDRAQARKKDGTATAGAGEGADASE